MTKTMTETNAFDGIQAPQPGVWKVLARAVAAIEGGASSAPLGQMSHYAHLFNWALAPLGAHVESRRVSTPGRAPFTSLYAVRD